MRRSMALLLAAMLLLFAGCTPAAGDAEAVFDSSKTVSGGGSAGSQVNVKELSISEQDGETVISLSFIKGSRAAGITESALSALPAYSVSVLPSPRRLLLSVEGVDFWDFEPQSAKTRSLVLGSFIKIPMGSKPFGLYFQLSADVQFSVTESAGGISLHLKPVSAASEEKSYVTLTAYDEFQEDVIPDELGFTPTLCDGLNDVALISAAFDTPAEADAFALTAQDKLADAVKGKKCYVQTLLGEALPVFNLSAEQTYHEQVLMKDGAAMELEPRMSNATFICANSAGDQLYVRTQTPDTTQDVERVTTDRLWLLERSGKKTALDLGVVLYGVQDASFSPDGRWLAILDVSAEQSIAYIYDTEKKTLTNLGEEGFGAMTSSIAWDENQPILYAMTGASGSLQLVKYDFNAVTSVEEQPGALSDIAMDGKRIYFADQLDGEGKIYAVDAVDGERSLVSEGMAFRLCAQEGKLAVCRRRPIDEELVTMDVVMLDLATGQEVTVLTDIMLERMAFLKGELWVTYIDPAESDEEFPYILAHSAGGSAVTYGRLKTAQIAADEYSSALMITDILDSENGGVPVTYEHSIEK